MSELTVERKRNHQVILLFFVHLSNQWARINIRNSNGSIGSIFIIKLHALAEATRKTLAIKHANEQVVLPGHQAVSCILSGACLHSLPPTVQQFVSVSPNHPSIQSKSLVFYVDFKAFGIDDAVEDGISDGDGCQQDDRFRRGVIRIESKS